MQSERPIETLLFKHLSRCLIDLNPIGIPVLRLDEANGLRLGEHFNSEALALLCMQQRADVVLLQSLAHNLERIREMRILIWLKQLETDLEESLALIAEQADKYNLMNLLVLHSAPAEPAVTAYRLEPFPEATFAPLNDSDGAKIFNRIWGDFRQRIAITQPSLSIPGSFLATDASSASTYLGGYMDRLIMEFARIYNIQLRFKDPPNESCWLNDVDIKDLVRHKQLDLPMYGRILTFDAEHTTYLDIAQVFIVVPCGKEMKLDDVFRGLRTYFLIMLGVYLIFSLLDKLFELASRRSCNSNWNWNWNWFAVLVNLRVFAVALGLPIGIIRRYRSPSMWQLLMIMYVFSLVFSCYFSASLSALLTKLPCNQHIQSFEQLQQSGLPILFDEHAASMSELQVNQIQIGQITNKVLAPNSKRNSLMFALNTDHAYQTFTRLWQLVNNYQSRYKRNALCDSPGLILFYDYPIVGLVQHNSIFRPTLNEFIYRAHDVGLIGHWIAEAMHSLTASVIDQPRSNRTHSPTDFSTAPLSNRDLLWVWKLLLIFDAAAALVFALELAHKYWHKLRYPIANLI